ncbi:MAG TPA: NAD(P)-binding domain-containing protein [Candidatus Kapabacteria bacterium]|nr:NAD(P)-binding domain-containing protein [Candidatus Kapabacteria bacterium]
MKLAVLGTGIVGRTIGARLAQFGHTVMMGSRSATNETAQKWAEEVGDNTCHGTFADAARHGEIVFNCTSGVNSLAALELAGRENLDGKVLIDVSNPLDFSQGFPPSLSVCNTDSLGEQIQAAYPDVKVVKTLNTMNCGIMVDPALVPGDHTVFVSGNDADAKAQVIERLEEFGWNRDAIIDLGDITTARGPEMMLPVWVRLYAAFGNANFNFNVVRAETSA